MMNKNEETKELTSQEGKQLEITEVNGKTTIVFRKAILKGKVSSSEVLNTILIAAKMQAEYYIKKLATGSPLEISEVKALKELGDITKLETIYQDTPRKTEVVNIDTIKSNLYSVLAEKLEAKQKENI